MPGRCGGSAACPSPRPPPLGNLLPGGWGGGGRPCLRNTKKKVLKFSIQEREKFAKRRTPARNAGAKLFPFPPRSLSRGNRETLVYKMQNTLIYTLRHSPGVGQPTTSRSPPVYPERPVPPPAPHDMAAAPPSQPAPSGGRSGRRPSDPPPPLALPPHSPQRPREGGEGRSGAAAGPRLLPSGPPGRSSRPTHGRSRPRLLPTQAWRKGSSASRTSPFAAHTGMAEGFLPRESCRGSRLGAGGLPSALRSFHHSPQQEASSTL